MRPIPISIIIPHFNDLSGLRKCLSALEAQTMPADSYEIIVADNASAISSTELSNTIDGRARLVIIQQRGAGPARNGGASIAHGDILAFLDSDCVPEPDWLERGVQALNTLDIVGGRVRVTAEDPRKPTPVECFEIAFAFNNKRYVEQRGFTVTANLFCRLETFSEVGGFRNGVPEDVEWCRRATAKGFKLGYAQTASVCHPARRNWESLTSKWGRLNREALGDLDPSLTTKIRWLFKAAIMPATALLHAFYVVKDHRIDRWQEKWAAIYILVRLRAWRAFDMVRAMWQRLDNSVVL